METKLITAAVMSGDTVSNVIIIDSIQQASQDLNAVIIEYTSDNPAGIGWTYNEETGMFIDPNSIIELDEEIPAE